MVNLLTLWDQNAAFPHAFTIASVISISKVQGGIFILNTKPPTTLSSTCDISQHLFKNQFKKNLFILIKNLNNKRICLEVKNV